MAKEIFLGAKVRSKFDEEDIGIVKTLGEGGVWVVFNCGGDWDNYQNYSGEKVRADALLSGWWDESLRVELWKAFGAGGFDLVNGNKRLVMSSGQPLSSARYEAAQLSICLGCELRWKYNGEVLDAKSVESPGHGVEHPVKIVMPEKATKISQD